MKQPELFTLTAPVRLLPNTRRQAHEKVKPTKKDLHVRLIKSFYLGEWNADAWADANNIGILSVRPRVSEINKAGLLHRIGFGETQDGNLQNRYTLFPFYKDGMKNLVDAYGLDKAAEMMVEKYVK